MTLLLHYWLVSSGDLFSCMFPFLFSNPPIHSHLAVVWCLENGTCDHLHWLCHGETMAGDKLVMRSLLLGPLEY